LNGEGSFKLLILKVYENYQHRAGSRPRKAAQVEGCGCKTPETLVRQAPVVCPLPKGHASSQGCWRIGKTHNQSDMFQRDPIYGTFRWDDGFSSQGCQNKLPNNLMYENKNLFSYSSGSCSLQRLEGGILYLHPNPDGS
jgi:hypothetical protein